MSLSLYFGPMFSEKTSTLIKEYNKYKILDKRIVIINHVSDTRYSQSDVISNHNRITLNAIKANQIKDINLTGFDVILIDEAQFFSDLYESTLSLIKNKKIIIIVGLDGNSNQGKFGQILDLIPYADHAVKLRALCSVCKDGTEAPFTKRTTSEKAEVLIGSSDIYQAVCRRHLN